MLELGTMTAAEHRRVADVAAALGIEVLSVGAPDYGVDNVETIDDTRDVVASLGDGDAVLIKASRAAGLERLAARLSEGGEW
jgi:UDP-N-acetylmuramoyl-tripeptide--D-alanyl-D-alanine ligase